MIQKQVENNGVGWVAVLFLVLFTHKKNKLHNVTNMTPDDARKNGNNMIAKAHFEMTRIKTRRCPTISAGDTGDMQEEGSGGQRVSNWGPPVYLVEYITEEIGQTVIG